MPRILRLGNAHDLLGHRRVDADAVELLDQPLGFVLGPLDGRQFPAEPDSETGGPGGWGL
jgi:hypothetical protein